MTDQPEALRLADALDTATAVIHRLGNDVLLDFGDGTETVEKAASELRRLHAENVDLKQTSAEHCPECGWRMLVPADGCRNCECAELRRDAERYRWLRDKGFYGASVDVGTDWHGDNFTDFKCRWRIPEGSVPYVDDDGYEWRAKEIDVAIDAAMRDEKK